MSARCGVALLVTGKGPYERFRGEDLGGRDGHDGRLTVGRVEMRGAKMCAGVESCIGCRSYLNVRVEDESRNVVHGTPF